MSTAGVPIVYHSDDGNGPDDIRLIKVEGWGSWTEYDELHGHLNYNRKRPIYKKRPEFKYPRKVDSLFGAHFELKNIDLTNANYDGSDFTVLTWIPETPRRYAYWDAGAGIYNEKGVALSESSTAGLKFQPKCTRPHQRNESNDCAYFDAQELTQVTLERAGTAIEALDVMTGLIETYGLASEDPIASGDSFIIADPEEVWVLHVSAISQNNSVWVAQKLREGHFTIVANAFIIRDIDFEDHEYFRYSANIKQEAINTGKYFVNDRTFDFATVFGQGEYFNKGYAGLRMWRAYELLRPDLNFSAVYNDFNENKPYPFSIRLTEKIGTVFFRKLSRDVYNGTEYDMTKHIMNGAFGNPMIYNGTNAFTSNTFKGNKLKNYWIRTIPMERSLWSHIVVCKPIHPYMWFAYAYQRNSFYSLIPFDAPNNDIFTKISPWVYDSYKAFWTVKQMNVVASYRYELIGNEIYHLQKIVESSQYQIWVSKLNYDAKVQKLNNLQVSINNIWRNFAKYLKFRFADQKLYDCRVSMALLAQTEWDYTCLDASELFRHIINLGYPFNWLNRSLVGYKTDDFGYDNL